MTPDTAPRNTDRPAAGRSALSAWLAAHGQQVPGGLAAAVVLRGSEGMKTVAAWPADKALPAWIESIAARALRQREPVVLGQHEPQSRPIQAIAHPVFQQQKLLGAVVLVRDASSPLGEAEQARLAQSLETFPTLLPRAEPPAAITMAPTASARGPHELLAVVRAMSDARNADEAAQALVSAVASLFDADRVCLGWRERQATRLVAGLHGEHRAGTEASADVVAALDEALDQTATVVFPPPRESAQQITACHFRLSDKHGTRSICTTPLYTQGRALGALLIERPGAKPFDAVDVQFVERLLAHAGPWLALRREADQPPWKLLVRALAARWQRLDRGRHRLAALAGTVLAAALLCWPVEREITAPVKLEGAVQRAIAAPGDGYLQSVLVRPGDAVKAGQLLIEFAAEDLRVERERLLAELGSRDAAAADALARQELGAFAVQSAKLDEARAQLALLDRRLERMRITAPFDAVVIQGDLSQALGAPMKKGAPLMVLAPTNDYRAVLEVGEDDIAQIRLGQPGAMVLSAFHEQTLPLAVRQITPLVSTAQGRAFFEVQVALDARALGPQSLRPGMRGIARLHGDRTLRAVVWYEQVAAAIKLAWWRWGV